MRVSGLLIYVIRACVRTHIHTHTVILLPTGYFGPLSSRVRGLFVKHTRTGNPLVDSVAGKCLCTAAVRQL